MAQDPEALQVIAWLMARPKLAGALLLTLALAGWHWQDKIGDWWDGRTIKRLQSENAALIAQNAALVLQVRQQEAATKAAQAARERNDAVIPKARRESAARVAAAESAGADDSVRLGAEAVAAYRRAADRLVRGKDAR